jgi:hypothetical protein
MSYTQSHYPEDQEDFAGYLEDEDDDLETGAEFWSEDDHPAGDDPVAEMYPYPRRPRRYYSRGYSGYYGWQPGRSRPPLRRRPSYYPPRVIIRQSSEDVPPVVVAGPSTGRIRALSRNLRSIDQTVEENTAYLDERISRVNSKLKQNQQQLQMATMLPLLIDTKPKLEELKVKIDDGAQQTIEVIDQKFKQEDALTKFLPLFLLGGMGGSGGGQSAMSNPLMLLVLTQALK